MIIPREWCGEFYCLLHQCSKIQKLLFAQLFISKKICIFAVEIKTKKQHIETEK